MTREEWIERYQDIWEDEQLKTEPCPEAFCMIRTKIPELQLYEKGPNLSLHCTIARYHLFAESGDRFQLIFKSSLDDQILLEWWIALKLEGRERYYTISEDVFLKKMKNGNEILRVAKSIEIDPKKNRLDFLLT